MNTSFHLLPNTTLFNVYHNYKCITYRLFKEVFEFEPYITLLPERSRNVFTQFRLGNTKKPFEASKWFNIDRNESYCTSCNRNEILVRIVYIVSM